MSAQVNLAQLFAKAKATAIKAPAKKKGPTAAIPASVLEKHLNALWADAPPAKKAAPPPASAPKKK